MIKYPYRNTKNSRLFTRCLWLSGPSQLGVVLFFSHSNFVNIWPIIAKNKYLTIINIIEMQPILWLNHFSRKKKLLQKIGSSGWQHISKDCIAWQKRYHNLRNWMTPACDGDMWWTVARTVMHDIFEWNYLF